MRYDIVLFDLDGTLTDAAPGITASVSFALDALGVPALDRDALLRFVGPPLLESFRDVAGLDDATAHAAVDAYRRYFTDRGMFENEVYPGISQLLSALRAVGCRLAVATSKPTVFAEKILDHFGLIQFFEAVCGADLDGHRAGKADIVTDALAALGVAPGPHAVLVGDRIQDVAGAHAAGIASIGAAWGYGSAAELAGAEAVVADAEELAHLLGLPPILHPPNHDPARPSSGEEALA